MRVLYFSEGYSGHDYRFLSKLAQSGHETFYLRLRQSAVASETRPLPPGIMVIEWSGSRGAPNWWTAWRFLKNFKKIVATVKPDLIHAGPVQTCGFLVALSGFKPFLLMSWGSDILSEARRSLAAKWVTRFTLRRSGMVQCDCLAVRDEARRLLPMDADRFVIFPWGVDLSQFCPRPSKLGLRQKLGWEKARIIISTRSFEPIYGTEVFLDALSEVLETERAVRVVMLGAGSLEGKVREFIQRHSLHDRIHLAGRVSNELLPDYMNEADLYIATSLSDGTSVSLLEAMACGLPVLVSDLPANREWVQLGVNGWLAKKGDTRALAAEIRRALSEESSWPGMAKTNVEVARQRADWDKNFPLLLRAYKRLVVQSVAAGA